MSANVLTLTDENFEHEVLSSEIPVVVDFWAPWCGPCRMLSPMMVELATDFAGYAKVAKLNVDEHDRIATHYGIQAIPTLLFFKAGQVVDRVIGVVPQKVLTAKLNALLESGEQTDQQAA